jgi:hypothetical protein
MHDPREKREKMDVQWKLGTGIWVKEGRGEGSFIGGYIEWGVSML